MEEQVAFGVPSNSLAVGWTSISTPPGAVYSDPPVLTWDYGAEQIVQARPLQEAGNNFLTTGSVLTSIQEVRLRHASVPPGSQCFAGSPPADRNGRGIKGQIDMFECFKPRFGNGGSLHSCSAMQ